MRRCLSQRAWRSVDHHVFAKALTYQCLQCRFMSRETLEEVPLPSQVIALQRQPVGSVNCSWVLPCIYTSEIRSQSLKGVALKWAPALPLQPDAAVVPDHSREAEAGHSHNRNCVRRVQGRNPWIPIPAALSLAMKIWKPLLTHQEKYLKQELCCKYSDSSSLENDVLKAVLHIEPREWHREERPQTLLFFLPWQF